MSFRIPINLVPVVQEVEKSFDAMFVQVLDCLQDEHDSLLELLILFEAMKQQVIDLAEERAAGNGNSASGYPYKHKLKEMENELVAADDLPEEARSTLFMLLAMAYYRVGSLWRAKNMALIARAGYISCGKENKAAFSDMLLAICSLELGQLEQADDRCILAIAEINHAEDSLGFAQIWQVRARILQKQERIDEAIASLVIAHEIYKTQGLAARQVKVILDLSLLFTVQKDWHGAIYHLKRALPVCDRHKMYVLELEVLHMLTYVFPKTGGTEEVDRCKLRIHRILGKVRQ